MAFTDLPDNLPELPVSDPRYTADFLDLVVPECDRRRGALAVLLCDDDDRMLVPMVIGDVPEDLSDDERERMVVTIVDATAGSGSVLLAVARADGLSVRPGDLAWRRAAERACSGGPRFLGLHVVTVAGSREVPAQAA